ncbi:Uncharacterised protein [Pandoraea pulmonicola]|uniref:Lipoprotein n=1 Tax=Pandoraea pulmonicola TaxID=93221 RepID=A0AAJ5CYV3_PANPU|nr:Uncharacterised protein [Pandoraea pulmonicola]
MMRNAVPIRRRMGRPAGFAAIVLSVLAGLGGCSPQQTYATGQAWHRSLCDQQPFDARSRCQADANRTYDSHRRDATPARSE